MSINVAGKYNSYTVTSDTAADTPGAIYATWAAELGVSETSSLYALDADDTAFPIDFGESPIPDGSVSGFFSSEGAIGWYKAAPTSGSQNSTLANVSRMFQLTPTAPVLLTFHPQADCRSEGIKLQRSGSVTILTGRIRQYASQTYALDFAARFNGNSTWQLICAPIDQPVDVRLFPIGATDASSPWTLLSTVDPGQKILITVIQSPAVLLSALLFAQVIPLVTSAQPLVAPKAVANAVLLRDVAHGGKGRIAGTVKEASTPEHGVKRRVRLHRKIDGMLTRETWSKPDGTYLFENIMIQPYYVVAFDHTGNYNGVIKDSIVPELMP